jgi:hypothetical protein
VAGCNPANDVIRAATVIAFTRFTRDLFPAGPEQSRSLAESTASKDRD